MSNIVKLNPDSPQRWLVQEAASVLRKGGLVAFPTETVYGLGADALNKAAVAKIFRAKERPGWDPLIVHVKDVAMARSLAKSLPTLFETLATKFWPGPLTMVVEKAAHVPDEVTARRPTLALRMPRHSVAAMLLAESGVPIAAPSANKFGRPSPTRAEHVITDLGDAVELVLDAGPTAMGVESTVLDLTQPTPAILRPGGVTREDLEAMIGPVTLAPDVADEAVKQGLAGPGMTASHYAPRARVELFETEKALHNRARELHGRPVGLIVETDTVRLAHNLFAEFRRLDNQGVELILVVLPPATGLGLAIRDRLQRAAGKTGDKS